MARAKPTFRDIDAAVVAQTRVLYDGQTYCLMLGPSLTVQGGEGQAVVGRYATSGTGGIRVKLTPGASTYADARAQGGRPFTDAEIVAAVIVAAIGGHPNADDDRAGTQLSAVWSHHAAVVRGEDPRRIATTFAPTETKAIAWRIQHMAALGVEVTGAGGEDGLQPPSSSSSN